MRKTKWIMPGLLALAMMIGEGLGAGTGLYPKMPFLRASSNWWSISILMLRWRAWNTSRGERRDDSSRGSEAGTRSWYASTWRARASLAMVLSLTHIRLPSMSLMVWAESSAASAKPSWEKARVFLLFFIFRDRIERSLSLSETIPS